MHNFNLILIGIEAHFVGDYLLQSDWMAQEKTKRWLPALMHGAFYTLPFLLITLNIWALLFICLTHIVIDRYRLVRQLIWLKNLLAPRSTWKSWKECNATGYDNDRPAWMTVWLMIITDNLLHILINSAALYYFGA
jgi:membrane associated rhomboid family serine protease